MSGARAEGWKESNSHGEERYRSRGDCVEESQNQPPPLPAATSLKWLLDGAIDEGEERKESAPDEVSVSDLEVGWLTGWRWRFLIRELGWRLPLPEKMSTKEDVFVLHAGRGLCRWRWIAVGGGDGLSVFKSVSWSGEDTLLPGQLMPGQTLNASISKSNFEEGSYSVKVDDNYFASAYFRSSIYWYEYARGANLSEYLQTDEFLKFEPDGYLRTYGWLSTNEPYRLGAISDVFVASFGFFFCIPIGLRKIRCL
nr:G-type lectin S-receptor-like serine/threonine-protein kinase SD2-5 [Ipomoea batatas]